MSKSIVILGCLFFLGFVGTSQAAPIDSPDTVYIDGVPCNRPCQAYMAWSRSVQSARHQQPASEQPAQVPPNMAARRAAVTRLQRSQPAPEVRIAKHAAPASIRLPPMRPAKLQPPEKPIAGSDGAQAKIGVTDPASEAAPSADAAQAKIANSSSTDNAASRPAVEAAPGNDAAKPKIADPSPAGDAAASTTGKVQAQIAAATAMALRMTVATVVPEPAPKANDADRSDHEEATTPGDADKTGSTSPNDAGTRVALLMARPEIKSVSDLTNKDIAIDDDAINNGQAAASDSIRTAIAAAGAAEVQLTEGQTGAIDRVIAGDVPAAVLALVSPQAAEAFPDIAGFRVFRIPIAPRSPKARL